MTRVLIVEDSATQALRIRKICESEGIEHIHNAKAAEHAEKFANGYAYDIAIIDVMLVDGPSGIMFAQWLLQKQPRCQVIVCSAEDHKAAAYAIGAQFVCKDDAIFETRLRSAIRATDIHT
jgi:DNA-binding response OmpR family regulator